MSDRPAAPVPTAHIRRRSGFQIVWLIPLVALGIGGFLAWRTLSERGPTITITLDTADGLQAGQTTVKHKAVDLGTVRTVKLTKDLRHVVATVEMRPEADPVLTTNTRFWVERPRLGVGGVSGLETLLSGAYIGLDPGLPGGASSREFTALGEPPAVRSDEPGTSFVLTSSRIGQLSSGSPVFYRDISVGEVLGYTLAPDGDQVTIHVFVRAPYDKFIRKGTHFWNASGLNITLGAQGVNVQLESLMALLSGGVAFDTSAIAEQTAIAPNDVAFPLFKDEATAQAAQYAERVPFLTRLEGSVSGLAVGAPVELFGIQVGNVTSVELEAQPGSAKLDVAVGFELQPARAFKASERLAASPLDAARDIVAQGGRMQLQTANLLTGQKLLSLQFMPYAAPAFVTVENGVIVVPSVPGGIDSITNSAAGIMDKLQRLPLDEIARNVNDLLSGANKTINGVEIRQALQAVAAAMTGANDVIHKVELGLNPALARLPQIAQGLQSTVEQANRLLGSANAGYGDNSEFRRNLTRLLSQATETARSVRLLTDFLDQHPEALIRGRTGGGP